MISLESNLKKFKHLALKEVAILTKENRLNKKELEKVPYTIIKGDKAEYRCCVYKERGILYERAILTAGYSPNVGVMSDLVKLKDKNKIIYVIESACDKCPVDRYSVTEACRGCIEHKCMEVCHVGAVTRVAGRAYIKQELCRECGMCKKACPYNAISEVMRPCKRSCPTEALEINSESKIAMINSEECIDCGACMEGCPFETISDRGYITEVTKASMDSKKVCAFK